MVDSNKKSLEVKQYLVKAKRHGSGAGEVPESGTPCCCIYILIYIYTMYCLELVFLLDVLRRNPKNVLETSSRRVKNSK